MIRAKKSLGQNFLKSNSILKEIVSAGEISKDDFVLEIGPGKGTLTEKILETGAKVLAVEKDSRLISFLQEKFKKEIESRQLEILEEDILEIEPKKHLPKKYKIIANIPYYITGQIIEKFLSSSNQPETAVFMTQKEVAKRVVANDGKESILSISVKAYGTPKYIKKVPARYFSPQPKVDSAILKIENISKKLFSENNISETEFFEILKAGFAHKRKFLISNLKEGACNKKTEEDFKDKNWSEKFDECGLDQKVRAEKLNVENWVCLID